MALDGSEGFVHKTMEITNVFQTCLLRKTQLEKNIYFIGNSPASMHLLVIGSCQANVVLSRTRIH